MIIYIPKTIWHEVMKAVLSAINIISRTAVTCFENIATKIILINSKEILKCKIKDFLSFSYLI